MSKLIETIENDCYDFNEQITTMYSDVYNIIKNDKLEKEFLEHFNDDDKIEYLKKACDYFMISLDFLNDINKKIEEKQILHIISDNYSQFDEHDTLVENAIIHNHQKVLLWKYKNILPKNKHLIYAVKHNNIEIFNFLLTKYIHYFDFSSCKLFTDIVKYNNIEFVKIIFEYFRNQSNYLISDCFAIAIKNNNIDICNYLLNFRKFILKKYELCELAISTGDTNIVKYLFNNDIKCKEFGMKIACDINNLEMVKVLVNFGIPINDYCLNIAVDKNNLEMVKYFKTLNVETNFLDIMFATRNKNFEMIKFLCENFQQVMILEAIEESKKLKTDEITNYLQTQI